MTTLPIDFSKRPWKEKYLIDETDKLKDWFIFGERDDGTVDINDGDEDIFINVPREIAQEIIDARDSFTEVIKHHFGYLR